MPTSSSPTARHRFSGQQPLIEIRKDEEPVVHREAIPQSMPAAKLDTLRVLATTRTPNKLVNVSIPFWLLRMAPSSKFSFMDNGIDFDSDPCTSRSRTSNVAVRA